MNYFNNGNNYYNDDDHDEDNDDDDNDSDLGNDDNAHGNANKYSLLQAVFLEEIIAGKYFNARIVSMHKVIYSN